MSKMGNNMKRYLYIVFAVLAGFMSSCSNSEMDEETYPTAVTILKVIADEGLQTRANATGVDRFAIEVYTDAAYTTPANEVFGNTNKANNATGEFTMVLDRTKAYYCLLWADKSGSSVYNITSLKEVTLTGKAVEAWQGTKVIAAGTAVTLDVSLTRAVSKISLLETGKLKLGSTLKLNFNQPTKFNVVDGTTSTPAARTEEPISITADVDGTTTPVKLNTTDIFVLSSVATANLTDLTFQFDSETAFTVSQAPLKANFNTNIKGHYTSSNGVTFTATADDVWGDADNNVNFPVKTYSIGDLYPDVTNPVGVVYSISDGGAHGKVISLNVGNNLAWSLESKLLSATSPDGAVNMATIQNESNWETNYPVFKWCVDYTMFNGKHWYLPSKEELMAIVSNDNLAIVNTSIVSAGGKKLESTYVSSTEKDKDNMYYVVLDTSNNTSPYFTETPKNGAYEVLQFHAFLAF